MKDGGFSYRFFNPAEFTSDGVLLSLYFVLTYILTYANFFILKDIFDFGGIIMSLVLDDFLILDPALSEGSYVFTQQNHLISLKLISPHQLQRFRATKRN